MAVFEIYKMTVANKVSGAPLYGAENPVIEKEDIRINSGNDVSVRCAFGYQSVGTPDIADLNRPPAHALRPVDHTHCWYQLFQDMDLGL